MDIELVVGDITQQVVDAVVNAANSTLTGGGGVDGAIHEAAGPSLLAECRQVRRRTHRDGLPCGQAVFTGAGDLPARWVIHTVGPNRHRGQNDPDLLASCFTNSLLVAAHLGARSVAFPAISAGAYGWDVRDVARVAVRTVRAEADSAAEFPALTHPVRLVRFVVLGQRAAEAFATELGMPVPDGPGLRKLRNHGCPSVTGDPDSAG
ncbi:MAG: O-acetyl-ADP-ribose deacetylase [Actinomycetota bacterium]|nr:O-acetyl-ADP-ribose deacetylase [Actinomycetota bacterium]